MIHKGPIPDGMWVLHKCDIRNCVNPDHLRVGAPAENVYDTLAKGRFKNGPKNGAEFIFEMPNGGYPEYPAPLDPSLIMSPKQRYNYERKIDRSGGPDACHPWTGSTQVRGYGIFGLNRRLVPATQLAIRIYSGPMPSGTFALHKCDNPRCTNHRHLWAGTQKENADDREAKGRGNQPRGDRSGRRLHPEKYPRGDNHPLRKNPELVKRGSNHWRSISLSDGQISEIRSLEGKMFYWQIGEKFGVSETTVWRIIKRNDWRSSQPAQPSS
jgi:hypothetical protein